MYHFWSNEICRYRKKTCQIEKFSFDHLVKEIRNLKKQGLGYAIHMKEYTIMVYLVNQISWSNNELILIS